MIAGAPCDATTLIHAHLLHAELLMVFDNGTTSIHIIETDRTIKADLPITVIASDPSIQADVPGYNHVRFGNTEALTTSALSLSLSDALSNHAHFGECIRSPEQSILQPNHIDASPEITEHKSPPHEVKDAPSDLTATSESSNHDEPTPTEKTDMRPETDQVATASQVDRPGFFDFLRRK